ncbi:MAG: ATP-binding cassette domain-containing protein [Sulfurospirillaceae bacterium]|nr:ATP-binding cassette domain-containing protein [Sulfurospirillaceae bacterium]
MPSTNLKISINNVSLCYGEKMIFENVNIAIQEHTITAIVGPSGIGKSSLLQILNQMIREEEGVDVKGEVYFYEENGAQDILKLHEDRLPKLRQKVVYVAQHPDILPFSIYDNMAFALRLQGLNKEEIAFKVEKALKQVFLWDEVSERLNSHASLLSGGQQQRLILARALALSPQVLLLDEPTASLNESLSHKIEASLVELKKEITIIIISHFKAQVQRIADTIFEIQTSS